MDFQSSHRSAKHNEKCKTLLRIESKRKKECKNKTENANKNKKTQHINQNRSDMF